MEPEKLKIIAEGMDYKDVRIIGHFVYTNYKGQSELAPYNPITNNDQNSELEEKLIISTDWIPKTKEWYAWVEGSRKGYTGKTPKEARCNAAYEYFK